MGYMMVHLADIEDMSFLLSFVLDLLAWLVETAGIEEAYRYFSKLLKTSNLRKARNLPIMPLCVVISQNW